MKMLAKTAPAWSVPPTLFGKSIRMTRRRIPTPTGAPAKK